MTSWHMFRQASKWMKDQEGRRMRGRHSMSTRPFDDALLPVCLLRRHILYGRECSLPIQPRSPDENLSLQGMTPLVDLISIVIRLILFAAPYGKSG